MIMFECKVFKTLSPLGRFYVYSLAEKASGGEMWRGRRGPSRNQFIQLLNVSGFTSSPNRIRSLACNMVIQSQSLHFVPSSLSIYRQLMPRPARNPRQQLDTHNADNQSLLVDLEY